LTFNKKKNIGFIVSDPAGLNYLDSYISILKNKSIVFTIIVSKKLAFSKKNKNISRFYIFDDTEKTIDLIKFLKNLNLDVIFLTQSSQKKSIVNKISRNLIKLQTKLFFVIQDYWGMVSLTKTSNKQKLYYLVLNNFAKQITAKYGIEKKKILISGNQTKTKNYSKIKNISKKNILFFSQPLYISGVKENLKKFCHLKKTFDKKFIFYIKPHPLDVKNDYYISLKKKFNVRLINKYESVHNLFLKNKIILNCFSLIGYEHSLYQSYQKKNIGLLLYVRIGKKINKTINNLKIDKLGEIPKDLPGIIINDQKKLFDILNNDRICEQLTSEYKNNVVKYFKKNKKNVKNFYKILKNKVFNI